MTKILLVDDHGVLRELIRRLLEAEPDLEVVGEAEDGEIGLQLAKSRKPDIVISDFRMKGMSGPEMIREIRELSPGTRVIILSMHENPAYIASAMNAGASGYVLKGSSFKDLLQAIHTVVLGQPYLSPTITGY